MQFKTTPDTLLEACDKKGESQTMAQSCGYVADISTVSATL